MLSVYACGWRTIQRQPIGNAFNRFITPVQKMGILMDGRVEFEKTPEFSIYFPVLCKIFVVGDHIVSCPG
jgi:hypothetical protein